MGFLARRFIRGNLHFVKSKKSHFYQQILRLTRFKRNLSVLYFRSLLFRNGWMGLKIFSKLTIKTPERRQSFSCLHFNCEEILLTVPVLKIKILLVPFNWSLRHRSMLSNYLPRRSQDCLFLWRKWIRTVDCGILAIKKLLWKPYKSDYIQSFLNVHIKHVQEKEKKNLIIKRKRTLFYLNFSSIAILKKQR